MCSSDLTAVPRSQYSTFSMGITKPRNIRKKRESNNTIGQQIKVFENTFPKSSGSSSGSSGSGSGSFASPASPKGMEGGSSSGSITTSISLHDLPFYSITTLKFELPPPVPSGTTHYHSGSISSSPPSELSSPGGSPTFALPDHGIGRNGVKATLIKKNGGSSSPVGRGIISGMMKAKGINQDVRIQTFELPS